MALAPRPSPFKWITRPKLRPGDILLSCGEEPLSQLIRKLAGGFYSHAAVWDGKKVVEAAESGVKRRSLAKDETMQWYIDAYRWLPRPPQGHELGDKNYPSRPVTHEADLIARGGYKFAYDELLMAAFVVSFSKLPRSRLLRIALQIGLAGLDAWIHAHLKGKRRMMCTEVVCRSFWRAKPNPRYAINIWVDGARGTRLVRAAARIAPRRAVRGQFSVAWRSVSDYETLQRKCARLFSGKQLVAFSRAYPRTVAPGGILVQPGGSWPAGCVTPRDLQRSPNLEFVGRLSEHKKMPVMPNTALGYLVRLLGMP